jgi:pimeloyl-ACP methyl ester carboxylesterase
VIEGARQRTVRSGGLSLAVLEAGAPEAPTIVCVHGYPDTNAMWGPVMARLATSFHVVAYDVRGAGQSSRPRGNAAYDLERLTEDFAAVIDAVSPHRPVHLVGHDWGGIQGWEFAASPLLQGRLHSFTTIAGPSLEQASSTVRGLVRRGRLLAAANRLRRSWYVVALCTPGIPTLTWRVRFAGDRWQRSQSLAPRVSPSPNDSLSNLPYPAPTLVADGIHGAKLYRRNIAGKLFHARTPVRSRVPVQLIVPMADRFISESYYELAESRAPRVTRRSVPGSHWAPRSEPELIARWVAEFAHDTGAEPEI